MGRPSDEGKRGVWRERLARFKRAGVTVRAFCEGEHVSPQSFFRWRRTLAAESSRGRRRRAEKFETAGRRGPFLPVRIEGVAWLEVELPNETRLRVPAGDHRLIETVIAAAAGVSSRDEAEAGRC